MKRINRQNNFDKIKMLYEQAIILHKYFLGWRDKLVAGYFVYIATFGYFIITYLQKPENFDIQVYFISCSGGILISMILFLLHVRINILIWQCQNSAYLTEKLFGSIHEVGLYSNVVDVVIRGKLDLGEKPSKLNLKPFLNPTKHFGAINWLFIITILISLSFFFQIGELQKSKQEYLKKIQNEIKPTQNIQNNSWLINEDSE